MKVAIPKLYFSINPQDNMDGYLKNTEKMETLTLRILDTEQKINKYLKTNLEATFLPSIQETNTQMALWRRLFTLSATSWTHSNFRQLRRSLGFGSPCYYSHEQYKNMIATLEFCGFTIFNPDIGLKLSDRARLEDVRHVYCHGTLNDKLTPASQTQLLRGEVHPDLPGIRTYHLGSNRPEEY
jgi:hypothetical protein